MNTKEKWIKDTEASLDGLQPAEVNPYLYSKIINRLSKSENAPAKLVWAAAGLFALLLVLNLLAFEINSGPRKKNKQEVLLLAKQYQLINDNTFSYN